METCKNDVQWFVRRDSDNVYIYVCEEHLIPAIKKYNPGVKVSNVIGCTSCHWPDADSQSERIAAELEELARRVSNLAQEILNDK